MKLIGLFVLGFQWCTLTNGEDVAKRYLTPKNHLAMIPVTTSFYHNIVPHGFIINGENATFGGNPYQITFQVRIGSMWHHLCGGAILTPYKALTAAHCVFLWKYNYEHRIGAGWLDMKSGFDWRKQTALVADITIHESYEGTVTSPNDIAILTLAQEVHESEAVRFAALPRPDQTFVGLTCSLAGWGRTSGDDPKSTATKLKTIHVPVIELKKCRRYWLIYREFEIPESCLCTMDSLGRGRPERGVCYGDSGGPLVCNNTLAGLISWGMSGCKNCYPDIHTDITYFLDWISLNLYP